MNRRGGGAYFRHFENEGMRTEEMVDCRCGISAVTEQPHTAAEHSEAQLMTAGKLPRIDKEAGTRPGVWHRSQLACSSEIVKDMVEVSKLLVGDPKTEVPDKLHKSAGSRCWSPQ